MIILCADINNKFLHVDTSNESLKKFDVTFNQKVITPVGPAQIVGVDENGALVVQASGQKKVTVYPQITDAIAFKKSISTAMPLVETAQSGVKPFSLSMYHIPYIPNSAYPAYDTTRLLTQHMMAISQAQNKVVNPDSNTSSEAPTNEINSVFTSTTEEKSDKPTSKINEFLKTYQAPTPIPHNNAFTGYQIEEIEKIPVEKKPYATWKRNEELYKEYQLEELEWEITPPVAPQKVSQLKNLAPTVLVVANLTLHKLLKDLNMEVIKPTYKNLEEIEKLYYYDNVKLYRARSTIIGSVTESKSSGYYFSFLGLRDKTTQRIVAGIHLHDGGKIESLIVDSNFKKHGYGTLLLACAIALIKSDNVYYLESSTEGLPTYFKLGFSIDMNKYQMLRINPQTMKNLQDAASKWDTMTLDEKLTFFKHLDISYFLKLDLNNAVTKKMFNDRLQECSQKPVAPANHKRKTEDNNVEPKNNKLVRSLIEEISQKGIVNKKDETKTINVHKKPRF